MHLKKNHNHKFIITKNNYSKLTKILLILSKQDFFIKFIIVIVFLTVLFNQPIYIVNHTVSVVESSINNHYMIGYNIFIEESTKIQLLIAYKVSTILSTIIILLIVIHLSLKF